MHFFARVRNFLTLVLVVLNIAFISVLADTFVENSVGTFTGTFSNTSWDGINNGVKVNTGFAGCTSLVSTTCSYVSTIKDSGSSSTTWQNLAWTPDAPYLKELPDNQTTETTYPQGNANMSGNIALWHLNEAAASPAFFADSSGNGNNLFCGPNCPVISAASPWGNARTTNTTTRYFVGTNGNSVKNLSAFSISLWATGLTSAGSDRVLYEEPTSVNVNNERVSLRITSGGQLVFRGRTNDAAASATTWVSIPTPGAGTFNIVATFDSVSDTHSIYVNGVGTSNNVVENSFPNTNPISPPRIARAPNNTGGFGSNFDEIAIFNRSLTATEALNFYRRGVSQNIRFQIRSCNDSLCSGENFVGPGGLTTTFFTEQTSLSNSTPSFNLTLTEAPINQYFQYRLYMASTSIIISPLLKSTTVTYFAPPSIAFAIRNSSDTADTNSCDLGVATEIALANCSYRLKVSSNAGSGYVISVQTSGDLTNGSNSISNALVGAGGSGGSNISAGTVGVERYGVLINPGSISSGGSITRAAVFDAGSTNSVQFNNIYSSTILQATNKNQPGATDLVNTSLVTHNLNRSFSTVAGTYAQSVTYTVVPTF